MAERVDVKGISPEAYRAMAGLEHFVHASGLEPAMVELVKIRASQINGCGYCLDMHAKDARAAGEREDRIYLLSAWHDARCYSPRERAALAWAEALTALPDHGAPDALYRSVREHFSEEELVALTMAVVAINGWNRLMVAFGREVGSYRPRAAER